MEQVYSENKRHRHMPLYTLCIAALLISIISILISGLAAWNSGENDNLIRDNSKNIKRLDNQLLNKRRLNLTSAYTQRIDENFHLGRANVIEHLTGVKVTGRIINFTSIVYESVTFKISMIGGENTFWIPKVSPGNSTAFEVYVPDVLPENAQTAWITYENGSLRYSH